MSRPEWWKNFVMNNSISRATHGAAPVEHDPAQAQQDQESLAFDVLLQVAKYLRQRKQVPAVLADHLADAIENAAQVSTTHDDDGNYPNRGAVLLKELGFVKETSGRREALSLAQQTLVVRHMALLAEGDHTYMKSQEALATKLRVSKSTIQRVWRKHQESNPGAE